MDNPDIVYKYFPNLNQTQKNQFLQLGVSLKNWNQKINLISRKDVEDFYEKHVLHSLAIAKVIQFKPGTKILDVGTGGGFPGLPLAILFPDSSFYLVDSIGKKINAVVDMTRQLGLKNVKAEHIRAEKINEEFDFIVSRAVTQFKTFYNWVRSNINPNSFNELNNGILYLKGGDFKSELNDLHNKTLTFNIKDHFEESFFETKRIVYLTN